DRLPGSSSAAVVPGGQGITDRGGACCGDHGAQRCACRRRLQGRGPVPGCRLVGVLAERPGTVAARPRRLAGIRATDHRL
ncbi:MAG: hypothetical protein AVDCRST_MAG75-3031, partial [uncultured Propionibacteriaceae bacterium]